MKSILLILGIVLFLAGCSPLKVSMVDDPKTWKGDGYLIAIPDVLIKVNANLIKGVCVREVGTISVPSKTFQAVSFPPTIGASSVDVEIKDGWLFTGAKVDTNTTEFLKHITDGLLSTVVPKPAAPAAAQAMPVNNECNPTLYNIIYNLEGQIAGLKEITIQ